jgi:hypothetical protein
MMEKELDAWSRFTCAGHFSAQGMVNPLVRLERYYEMPTGGALVALPAVLESGLVGVNLLFPMTVERPLQEVAMALIALSSVSRTLFFEAPRLLAPAGWTKILFSERLRDSQTVVELIKLICSAPFNIARWKAHCAGRLLAKLSRLDALLSVNGCRRLYVDGERVNSSSESARGMLLARSLVEPWEAALKGRPFFLVCGPCSSDRRAWLSKRIFSSSQGELAELRTGEIHQMLLNQHRITVIIGGGGLFPAFFEKLFKTGHHVLSHQLSEESPWPDSEFRSQDVELLCGRSIRLQFAERALPLADGVCFRELRCLTTENRQIGLISSDRELDLTALAGSVWAELSAVRFLDYLRMQSALDELCEGIVDPGREKANDGERPATPRLSRAFGPHHAIREFLDAIKLISFRAENMLAQIIRERVFQTDKAVLMLRDLLSSPADLVPNLKRETLTVRLRPQTLDGRDVAFRHLCSDLNFTETVFPGTDLRLVYEIASPG